jgi:DNA-directed RNA polymerase specialized sigma24 family protein
MMHSRGGRATGQDGQEAGVTPDDALATPTTDDERDLAELEAEDDGLRRAAESVERRRHDQQLLAALAAEGFEGARWRRFAEELARYGHAVLMAWQRTGAIFAQCKKKGRPLGPIPTSWSDQDRIDLATDVVVRAIKLFHSKGLVGGGWTVDGGASLRTFFIGACVLVYPTIYRAWEKQHENEMHQHRLEVSGDVEDLGKPVRQLVDPADLTVQHDEIRRGLHGMLDDRTRVAVLAAGSGYSNEEIATLLTELLPPGSATAEVSVGTVKQILHRHRRRVRKGETA